ncbi:BON domain-containing protein [Rhizobium oryzicola]|uniref:BON domain-containing protein n=1 Tax=Rhizobium oryzicola TaxID=1232668 RepID=A0ABT8SXK1_9HYPH|nr:BON domain-containing protein [Rhizobium oryzicola]MDO1583187.1 BON domain-containing protein [Rhizobium oryzicola]
MSEPAVASAAVILKILTGVQSGVDISLADGVYTLGSSAEDDIQVYDVSLKPGHARLRIADGKVQLAGVHGSLHSNAGADFPADGDYQELEPLDIVSAGATRFTTGLPTANWASITRDAATQDEVAPAISRSRSKIGAGSEPPRLLFVSLMVGAAVFGAVAFWLLFGNLGTARQTARADERPTLERVQQAVAKLPLPRSLEISRAVDGVTFVTGFTDNPAERRAVIAAVQEVDGTARVRLTVLETTRNEIGALLSKNYPHLDFTLDDKGVLTLSGIELDPTAAAAVIDLVRDRVAGLTSIVSNIRTSETLLADVRAMLDRSRLSPLVLLRLDGTLIEASGLLPIEKIDAWAGFLQAYASNIAPMIPLRSFVNLQSAKGEIMPAQAGPGLILGKDAAGPNEMKVDVSRLANGQFKPEDLFSNQAVKAAGNTTGPNTDNGPSGQPDQGAEIGQRLQAELDAVAGPSSMIQQRNGDPSESNGAPLSSSSRSDATAEARNSTEVARLLHSWDKEGAAGFTQDSVLVQGLTRLQDQLSEATKLEDSYKPLTATLDVVLNSPCWNGSRLSAANAKGIVFWLDMISVSDKLTIHDLRPELQGTVLEAALNPTHLADCLKRFGDTSRSVYLTEIRRNPKFVNFIVRSLSPYQLDVVGADLTRDRFVQIRNGDKLAQGSAPDKNSRVAVVGELGVAIRVADTFSIVIYGENVSWFVR